MTMTPEVMALMTTTRQAGAMTNFGATVRVVRFEPLERGDTLEERAVVPDAATIDVPIEVEARPLAPRVDA